MTLLDKLIQIKPRLDDNPTDAQYDFQKDWGIYKMINLYLDDKKFIICFEYHDDVIVLNEEKSPDKIDFYQVKSRKRPIDITFLTQKKGKSSIISKLIDNKVNFPICTNSLNIISDSIYKFRKDGKDKERLDYMTDEKICCSILKDSETDRIDNALKRDLSCKTIPDYKEITYFISLPFKAVGSSFHVKGIIGDLLKSKGWDYDAIKLYDALFGEVRVKTQVASREIDNIDDFWTKKAITFSSFHKKIEDAIQFDKTDKNIKTEVLNWINKENDYRYKINLRENYDNFIINQHSELTIKIIKNVNSILYELGDEISSISDLEGYFEFYEDEYPLFNQKKYYIMVVFLYQFFKNLIE
jgi:hypothetical protein